MSAPMTWADWISQPGFTQALTDGRCMYQAGLVASEMPAGRYAERCAEPATRSLGLACMHEHIWTEHFCQEHYEMEKAPGAWCEPCRVFDGHDCPVVSAPVAEVAG